MLAVLAVLFGAIVSENQVRVTLTSTARDGSSGTRPWRGCCRSRSGAPRAGLERWAVSQVLTKNQISIALQQMSLKLSFV